MKLNNRQTEYKTEIARLAEEDARREIRIILVWFGAVAWATAILGFLIRMPAPA